MKKLVALVIIGTLATGIFYTWKQEETLFKQSSLKYGGLKIHFFQRQLLLKFYLENQTDISLDITGYELQAYLGSEIIGTAKSTVTTHIFPRTINSLPDIIIDVRAENILHSLMNGSNVSQSEISIIGTIYGQKYYIPFSYPVNYKAKVSDLTSMLF